MEPSLSPPGESPVRTAAAVLVLALSLAATVAAAAPSAPRPAPGLWEASLSDGFLRFQVAGSSVHNVVVSYRCDADGGTLWSAFRPVPIRDGVAARDGFTTFKAAFVDARRARGSVDPSPGGGFTECKQDGARAFSARKLAKAPVVPAAGPWVGTDANGSAISFTVDPKGLVRKIESGLTTDCARRASPTPFAVDAVIRPSTAGFASRSRPIALEAGRFGGRGQDVDGTFRSARLARGTLREFDEGDRPCDSGPVAWTARPR